MLLCDDQDRYHTVWRQLRKERPERLLNELAEHGYDGLDFRSAPWAEMWDQALDD